jgi:predicted HTH transcriptional regulator
VTLVQQLANPTTAVVELLVEDAVAESEVLDFKGGRYQGPSPGEWSPAQEFAKDVVALANHRGGILVIGIRGRDKAASALAPITDVAAEREQRHLSQWLAKYSAPIVAAEIHDVGATAGGYYLVVVVPRSLQQPHAVLTDNSRRPLIYPVVGRHAR